MPKAKIQRISLALFVGIMPLGHFGTPRHGDSGGIVRAVVGHDKKPVAWMQLAPNVRESC